MTKHNTNSGTSHLLADIDDGVFTLTLNRPEARNALSVEMLEALSLQLERAESAREVRCIVLTGAGKGFCAGGDVKGMTDENSDVHPGKAPHDYITRQQVVQRGTAGRLFQMSKPTIAAINGAAVGAGLSLALACDLRIMSEEAVLMTGFSKVGLPGDFGGSYFMTQLIGTARARELFLLSDRVTADRALELGLTNWVCPSDLVRSKAMDIARQLAAGPSVAFQYIKQNLNRAIACGVDECLDMEAVHSVQCMLTADHAEAALAFSEKREPIFKGR